MSDILQHVQELDQSADVFIYELTNFDSTNPLAKFRFSNMVGVSFAGPVEALAVSHDTLERNSTGSQNRPNITVSDAAGIVSSLIDNATDGIEGAKLRIIRTKARFLDNGATPSVTNGVLMRSDLIISRVVNMVPLDAVVFETSNILDTGAGDVACCRVAHHKCSVRYRSAYCSYVGTAMFKLDGSPTLDPALDQCGKDIASCKRRFGDSAVLPHHGYPSLQRR